MEEQLQESLSSETLSQAGHGNGPDRDSDTQIDRRLYLLSSALPLPTSRCIDDARAVYCTVPHFASARMI